MRRRRDEPEDPIGEIEVDHSLAGMAQMTRQFYVSLLSQDFTDEQALSLTSTWLAAMLALQKGSDA